MALLLGAGADPKNVFNLLCTTADQNVTATPLVAPPAGRPATAQGCGALNVYRAMAVQLGYPDPLTPGSITLKARSFPPSKAEPAWAVPYKHDLATAPPARRHEEED